MSPRCVDVDLAQRAYEISVGRGVLERFAHSVRGLSGSSARRVFLVIDTGVPGRFGAALAESLLGEGFAVCSSSLTPSEAAKSLDTVGGLLVELARSGHTRVDPVVALGGGVVGDVAGFAAACYQRGTPVFQCPTTLLSMVDASVGGKTGVNLSVPDVDGAPAAVYKNLVGAFHQPSMVCADVDVLESLDERHRRCGLGECIKHAMICGSVGVEEAGGHEGLLDWTLENLDAIRAFDPAILEELIGRNVALKARVVTHDERESPDARAGGRMLLNFGHTFGHAIETLEGLSPDSQRPERAPLHHGEAVALGMVAACAAAESAGMCDASVGEELRSMLGFVGLPVAVAGLPGGETIVERMGHDKKSAGGELRVILPSGRGKCSIVRDLPHKHLLAGVEAIRS